MTVSGLTHCLSPQKFRFAPARPSRYIAAATVRDRVYRTSLYLICQVVNKLDSPKNESIIPFSKKYCEGCQWPWSITLFRQRSAHGMRRATFCLGDMFTKSKELLKYTIAASFFTLPWAVSANMDTSTTVNPATHDDHRRRQAPLAGGETRVTKPLAHEHAPVHRQRKRTPTWLSSDAYSHSSRMRNVCITPTRSPSRRPHPTSRTPSSRRRRSRRNAYFTAIGARTRSGR